MKLDLSRFDLVRRYVRPYLRGGPVRINGRRIQLDDVERIQIVVTDEPSEQLLPRVLAEREEGRKRGAIYFGSPGWGITRFGHAVTDEFLEEIEQGDSSDDASDEPVEPKRSVPESWDEVLASMVEAIRSYSQDRRSFLLARTFGGDSLIHPGFDGGELAIYFGDFQILQDQGYVHFLGGDSWDVTPVGTEYYDGLHSADKRAEAVAASSLRQRVFLVHGRDDRRHEVARVVNRIWGNDPIMLEERGGYGNTIIENFEHESSSSSYAIVLLIGEDEGRLRGVSEWKSRARQNVILELGYFFGKLGRNRVAVLTDGDIEHPSDINGLRYILLDAGGAWKQHLAKAMRDAGLEVDMNNL